MAKSKTAKINLGTEKISKLLVQQSVPAAIGLLSIIMYQIVDTIFVGNWIGANAIGAITVVLPITFLISSVGMAFGIGGASIIARALGAQNEDKAQQTLGNLIVLTMLFSLSALFLGFLVANPVLRLFGAQGEIFPLAYEYYMMLLPGLPFLAWAMMANNVVRAEGRPKVAMIGMIIPGLVNILLDALFIVQFDWGIKGAGLATMISYMSTGIFLLWFFGTGRSSTKINTRYFKLDWPIVREIFAIGGSTLARQGSISVLAIAINNTLFTYAGEMGVAVYGVINRMMLLVFFPVFGLIQGSLPIVGFNYGAKQFGRVRKTVSMSIGAGTVLCSIVFVLIFSFSDQIISVFSKDPQLIEIGAKAIKLVFMASPIIAIQALGASYFQAIGKAWPAFFLTLTRQGIYLIPLVVLLPIHFSTEGVWYAFPISDILAMITTIIFLVPQWKKLGAAELQVQNDKKQEKGEENEEDKALETIG